MKLLKIIAFSYRLGIRFFVRLLVITLVLPTMMKIIPYYAVIYRRHRHFFRRFSLDKEMKQWYDRKDEILSISKVKYSLQIEQFGLQEHELSKLKKLLLDQSEVVIAVIDQDGAYLSNFGSIQSIPTISQHDYLPRNRFNLELIATKDGLAIRKCYRDNKLAFLNELDALFRLNVAHCNVPAIFDLDFDRLTITMSYIHGQTLQEKMSSAGAIIHDKEIRNNCVLASLSSKERVSHYYDEGRRYIASIVSERFIEELFDQLKMIHQSGIELYDIKYGNILIEEVTGRPFLIDFEGAMNYGIPQSMIFTVMRDRDIEKFNFCFNSDKLTYHRIKAKLEQKDFPNAENVYAPVYFGCGLKIGSLWDVNVGYGRWNYVLKDALPKFSNKRILSLGVNNSYNELQMLRHGAREIVGFEIDREWMDQGRFFHEVFEWMDNRSYQFEYVNASMVDSTLMELGHFDLAVSLCSLYYLDEVDMVKVAQHMNTIADAFIVQCNTRKDIDRPDSNSYKRASLEYMVDLLKISNFSIDKIIAPKYYSRPILVAQRFEA